MATTRKTATKKTAKRTNTRAAAARSSKPQPAKTRAAAPASAPSSTVDLNDPRRLLTLQMVSAAVDAADAKKAEDIRILALDPSESGLADFFIICSGNSDRQNVAISDEIEARLKRDFGTYANSVEGRRVGEWVLIDFVDFLVHIFTPEKRAFYGLERLRKSATSLTPAELTAALNSASGKAKPATAAPKASKPTTAAKAPAKAAGPVTSSAKKKGRETIAAKGGVKTVTKKVVAAKVPATTTKTPGTTKKTVFAKTKKSAGSTK